MPVSEGDMRRLGLLACIILVVVAVVDAKTPRNRKAALRMLSLLKLVDGAGSGLDADTVRGVAPLVVIDAKGRTVGTWAFGGVLPTAVIRQLNGVLVTINVRPNGFDQQGGATFYYASADCSGARLLPADNFGTSMAPSQAVVIGNTAYYPVNPTAQNSNSYSNEGVSQEFCTLVHGNFMPPGTCCVPSAAQGSLGEATAFDLDSLGFVPPFHVAGS
jgi:hypothetical protein